MSQATVEAQIGPSRPPVISFIWFKEEFDKLHREHIVILERIDELEQLLTANPNTPITPELEQQVILAGKLSSKIDQKVPDTNVPPGSTTPPGQKP